jgi:hypothetical protein
MNPTMPPPVPACHGLVPMVDTGAASASMKKESWRRAATTKLNMMTVVDSILIKTERRIYLCC